MPVTEFALLNLRPSRTAFDHLLDALGAQHMWRAQTYPDVPMTWTVRFLSVTDPTEMLLTARWESVAAHWAWINSAENASAMGTLGPYLLKVEGNEDFSLMHVEGDLFGDEGAGLLESPVVGVYRVEVKGRREDYEGVAVELMGQFAAAAAPRLVKGGWREDVESEERQEYVVVAGWESEEEAREAERTGQFTERLGTLKSKFYEHVV